MTFTKAVEQFDQIIELLKKHQKLSPSYQLVLNALRNKLVQGAGEELTKASRK